MGSAPDTVNYKGEVLTDDMKNYLYGEEDFPGHRPGLGKGAVPYDRAVEILNNWMYGLKPKPVDPAEAMGRAAKVRPQSDRAAAGEGMGGLFGFGKYVGEVPELQGIEPMGTGPMAPGVPYKVPPLPKMKPGGEAP